MSSTLKIQVRYPKAVLRGKPVPRHHSRQGADFLTCWVIAKTGVSGGYMGTLPKDANGVGAPLAALETSIKDEIGVDYHWSDYELGAMSSHGGFQCVERLTRRDINEGKVVQIVHPKQIRRHSCEESLKGNIRQQREDDKDAMRKIEQREDAFRKFEAPEQVQRRAREAQRRSANRAPTPRRNAPEGSTNRARSSSRGTSEMGTLGRQIMNLDRSLGPNDYDLLLQLDERSSAPTQVTQISSGSTPRSSSSSGRSSGSSQVTQSSSGSTPRPPSSSRRSSDNSSVTQSTSGSTPRSFSSNPRSSSSSQSTQSNSGSTRRSSSSSRRSSGSSQPSHSRSGSIHRSSSSNRGDTQASKRSANSTLGEDACIVCYENRANACLAPCGHHNMCMSCAQRLSPKICPNCRAPFDVVIKMVGR